MYTVIIQNEKTYELFLQYRSLFENSLDKNDIGLCKWNESGTDIDTALPELKGLTDDKEEWKALIIRFEDGEAMSGFKGSGVNPYDFHKISDNDNKVEEYVVSDVPLIRLTQLLGGAPPFETEFEEQIDYSIRTDDDKTIRRKIQKPKAQLKEKYDEFVKQLEFDGKAPTEIQIISLRENYESTPLNEMWDTHKTIETSMFWKTNHYPGICRFLVYDFMREGSLQKEADNLNFWLSVLLLALNTIDPSALQAYNLYKISTVIDRNQMSKCFQGIIDNLRVARYELQQEIKGIKEGIVAESPELPDYKMTVPVFLNMPKGEKKKITPGTFDLLSEGASQEISTWRYRTDDLEEELKKTVTAAERSLNQAAIGMRYDLKIDDRLVDPLNDYQEEDIVKETNNMLKNIINTQSELPGLDVIESEGITDIKKSIEEALKKRVGKKPALLTFAFLAALIVASTIPKMIQMIGGNDTNVVSWVIVILIGIGISIGVSFLVLLIQKIKLNKLINMYNDKIESAYAKLISNADDYSDYLSEIASYERGCDYIDTSNQKKSVFEYGYLVKYRKINEIDVFIEMIKRWSKTEYIELDLSSEIVELKNKSGRVKITDDDELFSLTTGKMYPVELNKTGMTVMSPLEFTERLEIVREELYDNYEYS